MPELEPASTSSKNDVTARNIPASRPSRNSIKRPLKHLAIFGAVGALVAAVALPAYSATTPAEASTATVQQLALNDAQSLVVASEVTSAPLARGTYTATSAEEIAAKKAEEEAAARAAAAAAANSGSGSAYGYSGNLSLTAAGSGEVRYPLPGGTYYVSRTLGSGHDGADMVASSGTPIFAATGGVVRISSEGYYGYGVAVVIDGVVGGTRVSTVYAHMTYGSRAVSAGETVSAGQYIGAVGNTGNSYGSHLHFEVQLNGGLVEPMGWLAANAG